MPPRIILVRHGQATHNVKFNPNHYDTLLTSKGKTQCLNLRRNFPHDIISLIISSPLRRTLQTTAYTFAPALQEEMVRWLVMPGLQEVNDCACDVGFDAEELKRMVLEGEVWDEDVGFNGSKAEMGMVKEGWNSKKGKWDTSKRAVERRARDLRGWLWGREEECIVLVSHRDFLWYLTEESDADAGFKNCEVREYGFSEESTAKDAHFVEVFVDEEEEEVGEKEEGVGGESEGGQEVDIEAGDEEEKEETSIEDEEEEEEVIVEPPKPAKKQTWNQVWMIKGKAGTKEVKRDPEEKRTDTLKEAKDEDLEKGGKNQVGNTREDDEKRILEKGRMVVDKEATARTEDKSDEKIKKEKVVTEGKTNDECGGKDDKGVKKVRKEVDTKGTNTKPTTKITTAIPSKTMSVDELGSDLEGKLSFLE